MQQAISTISNQRTRRMKPIVSHHMELTTISHGSGSTTIQIQLQEDRVTTLRAALSKLLGEEGEDLTTFEDDGISVIAEDEVIVVDIDGTFLMLNWDEAEQLHEELLLPDEEGRQIRKRFRSWIELGPIETEGRQADLASFADQLSECSDVLPNVNCDLIYLRRGSTYAQAIDHLTQREPKASPSTPCEAFLALPQIIKLVSTRTDELIEKYLQSRSREQLFEIAKELIDEIHDWQLQVAWGGATSRSDRLIFYDMQNALDRTAGLIGGHVVR